MDAAASIITQINLHLEQPVILCYNISYIITSQIKVTI